ncbi:MAG TPA: hypothetical protein PLP61_15475, partial [Nocardioides sp.]|uniref:hypothetical protein n=1 Tax=Nocardioides sp. TaxID=35761 RepID=UPI002C58A50B
MTDDATPTPPADTPPAGTPPAADAAPTAAYATGGDGASAASAGRPSWRERVLGIKGVIAVGLASFILGGLG